MHPRFWSLGPLSHLDPLDSPHFARPVNQQTKGSWDQFCLKLDSPSWYCGNCRHVLYRLPSPRLRYHASYRNDRFYHNYPLRHQLFLPFSVHEVGQERHSPYALVLIQPKNNDYDHRDWYTVKLQILQAFLLTLFRPWGIQRPDGVTNHFLRAIQPIKFAKPSAR